jgi:hypothetical protein
MTDFTALLQPIDHDNLVENADRLADYGARTWSQQVIC